MRKYALAALCFVFVQAAYGQAVPSLIIPPSTEPTIVFSSGGKTYLVGQRTGRVTALDATPGPDYPIPPTPPAVPLTGTAKAVYDAIVTTVPAGNLKPGADALVKAIDATTAQIGGLGLKGQQIIDALAANLTSYGVPKFMPGFKLGDLLAAQGVDTDEKLVTALDAAKKAGEAVRDGVK